MTQDQNPPEGGAFPEESLQGMDSGNGSDDFDMPQMQPQLSQAAPAVAATQNKTMMLLLIVVAIAGGVIFMLTRGDSKSDEKAAQETEAANVAAPVEPSAPIAPPPPPMEAPEPEPENLTPPPLPSPPEEIIAPVSAEPIVDQQAIEEAKKQAEELRQKRMRSGMVITSKGIGGIGASSSNVSSASSGPKDVNTQFGKASAQTEVVTVEAERMANTEALVAQGKIIDVVLESAINTDLPSPIRAIVSRDVYAESGHTVLLPKGSRVIGRYNTDIMGGQKRVYIIWNRVIRPDGISILINAPGVDQIGRGGVEGIVDNKFLEIYSTAILTSLVTIGTAIGADQLVDGQVTTTTNPLGGGAQSTGSAGATAVQEAVSNLGTTTGNVVSRIVDTRPTITIDQGTRMTIFVNSDLAFPQDVLSGPSIVN